MHHAELIRPPARRVANISAITHTHSTNREGIAPLDFPNACVRHYTVVLIGLILLIAGAVVLATRDVVDVTAPRDGFEPLKVIHFEIVATIAGEVAFAIGMMLIAVWIGLQLGHRLSSTRPRALSIPGVLVAGIAIAVAGAILANGDRGEFLVGGPASRIDYNFLASILQYQLFQFMVVLGASIVVGSIAGALARRPGKLARGVR